MYDFSSLFIYYHKHFQKDMLNVINWLVMSSDIKMKIYFKR